MHTALVTAPAIEPVTLSEAKRHLRVDHTEEDQLILSLIAAARVHIEYTATWRALITQTFDGWIDRFCDVIELPFSPLQSVTSITYIDAVGVEQTLSASVYSVVVAAIVGRVELAYGKSWPTTREVSNAVKIRFVAGYGSAASDVPEPIKQGLLMLIGHLYENREMSAPVQLHTIPFSADALLRPYKVW